MFMVGENQKLYFHLLGAPIVKYQEEVFHIPRRQVRTLLYLLASQVQPIPYQTLHYLFWSDKPEAECRRNLSHLFTHLRNALPNKEALVLDKVSASLDPDLTWSDVIEFTHLCSKVAAENNLPALTQAHNLYQGAFLEGKYLPDSIELDKYIDAKRLHLDQLYLKNLSKLMLLNKRVQNFSEAIAYGEKYLELDCFNEKMLGELLVLDSLMGNQAQIMQRYEVFTAHLKQELDLEPSQKTIELYQQIRNSLSGKQPKYALGGPVVLQEKQVKPKIHPSTIDQLQGLIEQQNNCGGMILICGHPGMGKSNLITIYLQNTNPQAAHFRILCKSATQKIRFYPFRELAKALVAFMKEGDYGSMMLPARVLRIADQLSKPIKIEAALTEKVINLIFERDFSLIQDLFQELIKSAIPITISFEDLEWADEDSLEMILFLADRLASQKITLLCSFCCKKQAKLQIFEQQIQLSKVHLGTIELENLTHSETLKLVHEHLGEIPDADKIARQLLSLTGGNSLYLSEILQWRSEKIRQGNSIQDPSSFEIPPSITRQINTRLVRLSELEKHIIQIAAVQKSPLSLDILQHSLNLPESEIAAGLEDLMARYLLVLEDSRFRIVNPLVQQTVLENLHPAQKQYLEKTLAGAPRL